MSDEIIESKKNGNGGYLVVIFHPNCIVGCDGFLMV